jgi:hypothetical protein
MKILKKVEKEKGEIVCKKVFIVWFFSPFSVSVRRICLAPQ